TLQPKLADPAPPSNEANIWQARLELQAAQARIRARGRYTLIYWQMSDTEAENRLAQLNDNLKAFFIWHATRGIELPVPEKSLLAIQVKSGDLLRPLAGPTLDVPDKTFAVGSARSGELIRTP